MRNSIQSRVREHNPPQYCDAVGTTHAIDTAASVPADLTD